MFNEGMCEKSRPKRRGINLRDPEPEEIPCACECDVADATNLRVGSFQQRFQVLFFCQIKHRVKTLALDPMNRLNSQRRVDKGLLGYRLQHRLIAQFLLRKALSEIRPLFIPELVLQLL